ncbi:MAG: hypothetical protein XE11_0592 [Methanomicrobiales archaeon 53_19]|uniref:AAA family ATPase n=1 Tax=Methanocalculus sp. TaxID=2004547 RepID=UPI000748A1C0|nr:AAA family ATPase [Methanocalculus sp.]KUK68823.1 MAG: hypothetical protein XD88_1749 [Methanocalculus sp. 52_23]KUL04521.1 MAG: hypothetical protein XE11_0592 [Methanomicrobiales archaeon 53_19]HIJ06483.1 AAA family ATPase [Methanocalculus sp.]
MNDIQEVSIKNFRAIDEISFTPKRINIFVGPNNSGKSSALEAIALLKSSGNKCEDSLGVYVLGEIIDKYSMDYLFQDIEKPIDISYNNSSISIRYYSEGYPTDGSGALIREYLNEITQDYFNQPDTINRIRTRFFLEQRSRSTNSQKMQQLRLDGSLPSDSQRRLHYEDVETEDDDERLENYIKNVEKKLESHLYHKKKIVISGFFEKSPIFLYLILEDENMRLVRQQEEIFDFMRYRIKNFHAIYSHTHQSTGFVSDYDTEYQSGRVEELHDKVVRKNLISESHHRIISKIPYIEDIRKTDDGLFVSLRGQNRIIPLASMGEGFKSMLKIFYLSVLAKNGVITLEEPELSLHPGYIEMLADAIIFCSSDTQFFISTHSNDLIQSLLEVADQNNCLDSVQIIKMHPRLDTHTIEAEEIPGAEALEDIETINIDLRGI